MSDLNWELHMWQPDPSEPIEVSPLGTPAQGAHRLNSVESVFANDEQTLSQWRRSDRS